MKTGLRIDWEEVIRQYKIPSINEFATEVYGAAVAVAIIHLEQEPDKDTILLEVKDETGVAYTMQIGKKHPNKKG